MTRVDPRPVTVNGPQRAPDGGAEVPAPPRTVSLGAGRIVPYPEPKDAAATNIGKANPRAGTKPEVRLRSMLHRRGHRFRKDHLVRLGAVRVRPDLVFTRWRLAVFVDGCFWHRCAEHGRVPKTNTAYWVPKLAANEERDRRVNAALADEGWVVLRIWEHVDVHAATGLVEDALRKQRALPSRGRRAI